MGSLRFILAISVVYGHLGDFLGFPLVPGDTAVQCFYAISGFYMTLILTEKYRPESTTYFLFISNRFLRLYPAYITVVLLTLLFAFLTWRFSSASAFPFVATLRSIDKINWSSAALLIGAQLFMWSQDLYIFLTLKNGALVFWPDFHNAPQPLYPLLIIPQAWTLGLEFSFYLVAPFIVRRSTSAILLAFAASLAFRLFLQFGLGYRGDPWSYRFFPSEFAVFLLGALGYRIYKSSSLRADRRLFASFALAILCLGIALIVNRWHGFSRVASVCFWMVTVGSIPFLFRATKDIRIDRYFGELSYPIYISHFLVMWLFDSTVTFGSHVTRGVCIIGTTLLVSAAIYGWIDRPIDEWRHWRIRKKRKPLHEVQKELVNSRI